MTKHKIFKVVAMKLNDLEGTTNPRETRVGRCTGPQYQQHGSVSSKCYGQTDDRGGVTFSWEHVNLELFFNPPLGIHLTLLIADI